MIKLKELRTAKNISQIELANYLHVSNTTVSNWESGKRIPDMETLIQIANYFDVSLDYLLGRDNSESFYINEKYILKVKYYQNLFQKISSIDNDNIHKLNEFIDLLLSKSNEH